MNNNFVPNTPENEQGTVSNGQESVSNVPETKETPAVSEEKTGMADDIMTNSRPHAEMHTRENRCPRCGTAFKEGAAFCGNCGLSLQKTNDQPQPGPDRNNGAPMGNLYGGQPNGGLYQSAPNWNRHVPVDTLSTVDYILMMVLFSLPIVGLVLMLYWSFSSSVGVNRKHFARAYLIFYCISFVLGLIFMGVMGSVVSTVIMDEGVASLF